MKFRQFERTHRKKDFDVNTGFKRRNGSLYNYMRHKYYSIYIESNEEIFIILNTPGKKAMMEELCRNLTLEYPSRCVGDFRKYFFKL